MDHSDHRYTQSNLCWLSFLCMYVVLMIWMSFNRVDYRMQAARRIPYQAVKRWTSDIIMRILLHRARTQTAVAVRLHTVANTVRMATISNCKAIFRWPISHLCYIWFGIRHTPSWNLLRRNLRGKNVDSQSKLRLNKNGQNSSSSNIFTLFSFHFLTCK